MPPASGLLRIGLFVGSFDPFTLGHYDVAERALPLFDRLVIGVGVSPDKHPLFSADERRAQIARLYASNPRVQVCTYQGLTAHLARRVGAQYIVRGIRSVTDLEYERGIAQANKLMAGLETVFLFTSPQYAHISGSLVRELLSWGEDISALLPPGMTLRTPQSRTV